MRTQCMLTCILSNLVASTIGKYFLYTITHWNSKFNIIFSTFPFKGYPFLTFSQSGEQRQFTKWTTPVDDWNITSVPRSIIPHFQPRNLTHNVPLGRTEQDEELLVKLNALKVTNWAFCDSLRTKIILFFIVSRATRKHECFGLSRLTYRIIHRFSTRLWGCSIWSRWLTKLKQVLCQRCRVPHAKLVSNFQCSLWEVKGDAF